MGDMELTEERLRRLFEAAGFDPKELTFTPVSITEVLERRDYPTGPWFQVQTFLGPLLIGDCNDRSTRLDWDKIGREIDKQLFVNPPMSAKMGYTWVHASGDEQIVAYLGTIREALTSFSRRELASFVTGVDFSPALDQLTHNIVRRMLGREPKSSDPRAYSAQVRECRRDLQSRQFGDNALPDPADVTDLQRELMSGRAKFNPEIAAGLKHAFLATHCAGIPERLEIRFLPTNVLVTLLK